MTQRVIRNDQTPPERELVLSQATARVERQIEQLGLERQETSYGQGIGSVLVHLHHPASGMIADGSGKGTLDEATTGARFEALEHYLDQFHPRQLHLRRSRDLAVEPHLNKDFLLPWLKAQPGRSLACQRYNSIDGQYLFDYPVGVTQPDYADHPLAGDTFDYAGLRRYASNDGAAIGASRNEALLHALNQIIERDALSLFMLRHFYYRRRDPVRLIARVPPESALGLLWEQAEQCLHSRIALLDISSEFISSTLLALCLQPSGAVRANLVGCGASLDPWHAARRALSELVQLQFNSRTPQGSRQLQQAGKQLLGWPKLQRSQKRDIAALLETATLHRLPEPQPIPQVGGQLQILCENLEQHGRQVGVCEVFRGDEGITLVNLLIPGLERFHLVWSGNLVLPGPRGQALG